MALSVKPKPGVTALRHPSLDLKALAPPAPIEVQYVHTRSPLVPGVTVDGKYRIERLMGEGGMGVVVAATHLQLDIPVAIKTLLPDWMNNPEIVSRFEREAKAAAKISSEHVVRVTDVGTLEQGLPYIVMEYVEGMDLDRVLSVRGPLPVPVAVDYVLQACEAVAEAHVAGIVHRDIKPSNLFLSRKKDGSELVKVFDFGISKIKQEYEQNAANITQASIAIGTPSYMAPEQMKSAADADERCDIWSLGMVLHELVAGRPAFEAGSVAEIMAKVISSIPAPPLSRRTPDIPSELNHVVSRCLEKKPHNRYQNVMELAIALEPLAPAHAKHSVERIVGMFGSVGIPAQTPRISASPKAGEDSIASVAPSPQFTRRRRTARLVAAAVGLVVIAIGALSLRAALASGQDAPASVGLASTAALHDTPPIDGEVTKRAPHGDALIEVEPADSKAPAAEIAKADPIPTSEPVSPKVAAHDPATRKSASKAPTPPSGEGAAATPSIKPTTKPTTTNPATEAAPKPVSQPAAASPPKPATDPFANPYGGRK